MSLKVTQEKRGDLAKQMHTLVKESGGSENWSNDDQQKFNEMDADLRQLDEQIANYKRLEEIAPKMEEIRENSLKQDFEDRQKPESAVTEQDRRDALRGWIAGQHANESDIRAAKKVGVDLASNSLRVPLFRQAPRNRAEARAASNALNSTTTAEGAGAVPNDTMQALEEWLVAWGGMRQASRVLRTQSGGTLPIPTVDETATTEVGKVLAQNTASTIHTPTFGQVTLSAYKYTSNLVQASIELLQDANFSLGPWLGQVLGTRIGRVQNAHFTVGTQSGQPGGVAQTSTNSGKTGVTASTYATPIQLFSYANLLALFHSVDPAYRASMQCYWMFNDNTLSGIKSVVDGDSRPLWLPSITGAEPDRILGKPYIVNQDMPTNDTTAGGEKLIAFGDFSKYYIREVMGIDILRLNERYAEAAQVAWVGFARADGVLVNRDAVKLLVAGAT